MKKLFFIAWLVLTAVACNGPKEKTAYIDLNKVVEEYDAMKNIKKEFDEKQAAYTKKYDSLALAFQQKYQDFLKRSKRMNPRKAQEEYNALAAEQQNIQLLQQRDLQQLQEEFDKKTREATDKLKDFIRQFGEQNGYTYIFSQSELAGVAYGKKEKNITDEFIKALNAQLK